MDAYEDTLKAFDDMIDWLGRHPNHEPATFQGQEVYILRHLGDYGAELRKRCERLVYTLNHLIEDGLALPNDYTWRRFRETMSGGCMFDLGSGFHYDVEGQQEVLRVIRSARDELVRMHEQRPSPPAPQPHLTDEEYESVLSLIRRWAEGLERSPDAFRTMDEEALRTSCLVMLNSHHGGRATAETFNKGGKTDILIRVGEGAVFVAECKVWNGPAALRGALDQLLGYLTWRDTKAALLVFNRSGSMADVVAKVRQAAVEHPQHRWEVPHLVANESRHVLSHPDDPSREVIVTLQVVELPTRRR